MVGMRMEVGEATPRSVVVLEQRSLWRAVAWRGRDEPRSLPLEAEGSSSHLALECQAQGPQLIGGGHEPSASGTE